jgi:hypothetical protein
MGLTARGGDPRTSAGSRATWTRQTKLEKITRRTRPTSRSHLRFDDLLDEFDKLAEELKPSRSGRSGIAACPLRACRRSEP